MSAVSFKNKDSTVSSIMNRQEFAAWQSEKFVEEIFGGPLPQFLVALSSRKKLSESEISELQRLIGEGKGES